MFWLPAVKLASAPLTPGYLQLTLMSSSRILVYNSVANTVKEGFQHRDSSRGLSLIDNQVVCDCRSIFNTNHQLRMSLDDYLKGDACSSFCEEKKGEQLKVTGEHIGDDFVRYGVINKDALKGYLTIPLPEKLVPYVHTAETVVAQYPSTTFMITPRDPFLYGLKYAMLYIKGDELSHSYVDGQYVISLTAENFEIARDMPLSWFINLRSK